MRVSYCINRCDLLYRLFSHRLSGAPIHIAVSTHFHTELSIFFSSFCNQLKFFSMIFYFFFAKYINFFRMHSHVYYLFCFFYFNSVPFPLFKYVIKLIWTMFYFSPFDSFLIYCFSFFCHSEFRIFFLFFCDNFLFF